jgi:hypothetical protein
LRPFFSWYVSIGNSGMLCFFGTISPLVCGSADQEIKNLFTA